jgi:anti-sigma-K factor RskA
MSAVVDNGNDALRYAEYVLGVLDADARAAVAAEVRASAEAASSVALWERHLMPLADEIGTVAPPPYVWARIADALKFDASPRATTRDAAPSGFWNNLRLWQWIGIGASALAAACLVVIVADREAAPTRVEAGYMVATIAQDNGVAGWTATMDLEHSRMLIVPATPPTVAADRATELWLIPAGQKPISVGVITPDKPNTIALTPKLVAQLGPTALLAISLEPAGGSPTGQPTGPVVAKGAISGAPETKGKVALRETTASGRRDV